MTTKSIKYGTLEKAVKMLQGRKGNTYLEEFPGRVYIDKEREEMLLIFKDEQQRKEFLRECD